VATPAASKDAGREEMKSVGEDWGWWVLRPGDQWRAGAGTQPGLSVPHRDDPLTLASNALAGLATEDASFVQAAECEAKIASRSLPGYYARGR